MCYSMHADSTSDVARIIVQIFKLLIINPLSAGLIYCFNQISTPILIRLRLILAKFKF